MGELADILAELRSKAIDVFGHGREVQVEASFSRREDEETVLRVIVTYEGAPDLAAEEMALFMDSAWQCLRDNDSPFPVIDFLDRRDIEQVAAE